MTQVSEASTKRLAGDLFGALHRMEEEADTVINGYRAGLVDFAGHAGVKTRRYEVPIYRCAAEILRETGWCVETDVAYPDGSGRICDLTVRNGDGVLAWIEFKLIWRHWLSNATKQPKTWEDESYMLGPTRTGRSREHSLAQDFEKLESLTSEQGTHVFAVALGYDSHVISMTPWLHRLAEQNRLDDRGWHGEPEVCWADRNDSTFRIRAWLWRRSLTQSSAQARSASSVREHIENRTSDAETFMRTAEEFVLHYRGKQSNEWLWEDLIASVLSLPRHHALVARVGARLRKLETPYTPSRHAGRDGRRALVERILDLTRSDPDAS